MRLADLRRRVVLRPRRFDPRNKITAIHFILDALQLAPAPFPKVTAWPPLIIPSRRGPPTPGGEGRSRACRPAPPRACPDPYRRPPRRTAVRLPARARALARADRRTACGIRPHAASGSRRGP